MRRMRWLPLAAAFLIGCDGRPTEPDDAFGVDPAAIVVDVGVAFAQVSAGPTHACALRTDGALTCWGDDTFGQTDAPAGTGFQQVSAGTQHSCALTTDGSPVCWGDEVSGEVLAPAGVGFTQVSAGNHLTCVLSPEGAITCWGRNDFGQATPPVGTGFVEVHAGGVYGCALAGDGSIACWGSGYGTENVPAGTGFSGLSAGATHACALASDASLVCWGDDRFGQATPPAGIVPEAVSAGWYSTCALKTDGSVTCWGDDEFGQVGAPADTDFQEVSTGHEHTCALKADGSLACWGHEYVPVAPETSVPEGASFAQVSAGPTHACALGTDGALTCWGDDTFGQTVAPAGTGFQQVSAGTKHSCALRTDGSPVCWGDEEHGEVLAPTGVGFIQVSAGNHVTCVLSPEGAITCWGRNDFGQATPPVGTGFVEVQAGGLYGCALAADGSIACWGSGSATEDRPTATGFAGLSAGATHACALASDGSVVCWGDDRFWQATPPVGTDFAAVSAGWYSTCALRTDGSVECWGDDEFGQIDAPPDADFQQVSTGHEHACALKADGSLSCWGDTYLPGSPPTVVPILPVILLPEATFVAPNAVAKGLEFTLSLEDAQVPGYTGDVAFTYAFDCGDGNGHGPFGAASSASCTAAELGALAVKGTVKDRDGQVREYSARVEVVNGEPTILPVAAAEVPAGEPFTFTAPFLDPGVDVWACSIEWGDGATEAVPGCTPTTGVSGTHVYGSEGIYLVTVQVTDGEGATGITTFSVTVTAPIEPVDVTPPVIAAEITGAQGTGDWYTGDVTVTWTVTDPESEITSAGCPATTVTTDTPGQEVTCSATSLGGTAEESVTVRRDATPPQVSGAVSGTLGIGDWYVSDVEVLWTVADALSGVAGTSGCGAALLSDDTGQASFTCTASDGAGNAAEASVSVRRDATAPVVAVTGVVDGAVYTLGEVPAAGCTTTDATSGVAQSAVLAIGGGNPDGAGTHTASCSGAVDGAGNTGSATVSYTVGYPFDGFLSPVANPPSVNSVRAGRAVPLKFGLGGDRGLDVLASGFPRSEAVTCDAAAEVHGVEETTTAGSSGLQYDPLTDTYTYVWQTDKSWTACRQLVVRLVDGTSHRATFEFR